ncbi:MAG: ribbon-helix-helix domain-containing protein [Bacillota bacterium]
MPMARKQIYLDPTSNERLKKLAKKRGVSEASLIREAVDAYLEKAEEAAAEPGKEDPLLRLVGIFQGELPPDAAVAHDRYLYGDGRGREDR